MPITTETPIDNSSTQANPSEVGDRSAGRARRIFGGLAVAAVATVSLGVGSVSAQSTDATDINARVERACLRVPNLRIRTDNILGRITGDADTAGSLLWLDTKIAQAQANDRTELVTVLENRRAVREQSVVVLTERSETLVALAARCSELGIGG